MEKGPTVFDSLFHPDISFIKYDGIRPGWRRYNFSSAFSHTTDAVQLKSSSANGRVIPIKVEHITTHSKDFFPRSQPKKTLFSKESPIIVEDESIESRRSQHCRSDQLPALQKRDYVARQRNASSLEIKKSVVILDDEVTEVPVKKGTSLSNSFPSDSPIGSKSSAGTLRKSIPVQHLKSSTSSPETKNTDNCLNKQDPLFHPAKTSSMPIINDKDSIALSSSTENKRSCVGNSHSVESHKRNVTDLQNKEEECFDKEEEINPTPTYPIYDVLKVKLAKENRKIDYIRGDGNCFFRALSKQLYGSERYHKAVRNLIVDLIATNKAKFAQFVDGEDVQVHIERMSEDHCWATTCEIYAAASLLQRNIYMLTPDHLNMRYSWLLFKPIFESSELYEITSHPCFITLCNTNGNHYDRVVPDHSGCNCFALNPELDGVSDCLDLT